MWPFKPKPSTGVGKTAERCDDAELLPRLNEQIRELHDLESQLLKAEKHAQGLRETIGYRRKAMAATERELEKRGLAVL